MSVKTIYLMRHGETDLNAKRCFYGSLDVPLNEKGRQQCQMLHNSLADKTIEQVCTTPLQRAQQSAQIIFDKQDYIVVDNLSEKGFGLWEGLDANQIQAAFPVEWQAWLDAPFTYTPPQAESFAHFEARVIEGLHEILAMAQESVAIVAHLGVLRIIYQQLIDKQMCFWDIDFPQGSATRLTKASSWHVVEV